MLKIARTAAIAVRKGHPWVYRDAVAGKPPARSGAVELADETGRFLANGLWDEASPLAVRVGSHERGKAFDASFVAARAIAAIERRDALFDTSTDAHRLCNGEGDRLPGVVIDRYAHVAVARLDTEALDAPFEEAAQRILGALTERGVRSLAIRRARGDKEGETKVKKTLGEPIPDRIVVREHGMAMEVDLAFGQKTGAFLDQRENRRRVRDLAAPGPRALNLFSYAGGFSLAAALGGAPEVTSVDIASAAHASAQRSFRENGLDPQKHRFVSADAFAFLDQAQKRGERWDLLVSDPPSFAPNERAKEKALAAYRKLHAAAAAVLAPRGILCAASCSSHVTMTDFLSTLDDAALGGEDLRVLEVLGQPADHPSVAAWPEGRYLKFVVLG